MKNNWNLILAVGFCVLLLAACKKAENKATAPANAQQQNQDVSNSKSESDNSDADINSALNNTSGFGKNQSIQSISICGATVDSSHMDSLPRYIVIKYDSTTPCGGRIRSGQVKVELVPGTGTHWSVAGAQLQVTYTNYKISYTSGNHSITFNGTKYMTDLSGINWFTFLLGASTFQFSDKVYNMAVTFDDGSNATWNISRVCSYSYKLSTYTIFASFSGDTLIGGDTIDSWGVTRWGSNFTVQELHPWQANSSCYWAPTSGEYTCVVQGTGGFSITATLGLNSDGTPYTQTCPYGFQIAWVITSNGSNGQVVLPYWW